MSNSHREIEIKIWVDNLKTLEQTLIHSGAICVQERVLETNMRYDSIERNLSEQGIVLRLRQDTKNTLTYKSPAQYNAGISSREELEIEHSNHETLDLILKRLGFTPYLIYEKYRTVYQMNDTLIMLDELPYGDFVEIEGAEDAIKALVKSLQLNTNNAIGHSYSQLFNYVKHHLNLTFDNLTFKNFKDISVPQSAFIPPGSIIVK